MKRRKALSLIGGAPIGLSASASLIAPTKAATAQNLDPNNAYDLYVIHRKLNYTFDDNLVFWFIEAVRNGLVDTQFTPFWNMNVGFIASVKDLDDDRFEVKTMSAIFYTDLESGKLIDNFDNPFTGERIPVRQPRLGVSTRAYNIAGLETDRPSRPGVTMTEYGAIGPAWIIGDDIWCRGDTGFRAEPTDPNGRVAQVNDWFTYHGSISEVSDPDVKCAAATQSFNDINTWPGWLNMGDHPGNYVSRGFGRKVKTIEDMPETWRRYMREQNPKEFADPRAAIHAG